jgi:hypothetical protein
MRLVVFTSRLSGQTGGEVNVRQWALGLKARGHQVIAYAPVLGALAEEIRAGAVAVVDDPGAITDRPDVMFGSGINEVATLAARFPDVPQVQVSQQWDNWASYPSPLPQAVLHVAVDAINAESLANEFGVLRERIRIVYNAVDLARMPERAEPLPDEPSQALIFVKQHASYVDAVRTACSRRGIVAEPVGPGAGAVIDDPLAAMASADLVIGSARVAIEAAAAGAAVLVADHRGLAGLLTTANFERFRSHNFGRKVLTQPLLPEQIGAELDRYDADDAAAVSALMRDSASLDGQLERLEAIFTEALGIFRQMPVSEDGSRRALATYLARHLPRDGEASPRHGLQTSPAAEMEEVVRRLSAVAERVSALEVERLSGDALDTTSSGGPPSTPAPARNLLQHSEALDGFFPVGSMAMLERIADTSGDMTIYQVTAIGGESEHYTQHAVSGPGGPLAFSLEAHAAGSPRLRIQMLDGAQNGIYADFDFRSEDFTLRHFGVATRLNGGFRRAGDGWYRLWLSAVLPAADASFVIQLADQDGRFTFPPAGESVMIRALQLERGQLPTPYART